MAPTKQVCVFCRRNPESKNREHILPQWLIALTGDPKRVVTFGVDYSRDRKPIRFDWSSLVVPACKGCNGIYSDLERRAQAVVLQILNREALSAESYLVLLDWLDKVRVGIWLNYRLLQNHPMQIEPHFYIDQRKTTKDRMVGIHLLDGGRDGLNLFGSDSLIFAEMPSCFSLRINSILLTNVSSDFFCSKSCGFPYPSTIRSICSGPDAGRMSMTDFRISRKCVHPISDFGWIKPSVLLYQPIMLQAANPPWHSGFLGDYNMFDAYLHEHRLADRPGHGVLFRQWADRVEPIYDMKSVVEFDVVNGNDSKTLNELVAQTYDFQVGLYRSYPRTWAEGCPPSEFDIEHETIKIETTSGLADFYRQALSRRDFVAD